MPIIVWVSVQQRNRMYPPRDDHPLPIVAFGRRTTQETLGIGTGEQVLAVAGLGDAGFAQDVG
jgi:hypothetical protein